MPALRSLSSLCGPSRSAERHRAALWPACAAVLASSALAAPPQGTPADPRAVAPSSAPAAASSALNPLPLPLCPSDIQSGRIPFAKETKPDPNAAIDMAADKFVLGANGDATLQGNVAIQQGDRQVLAQDAHYDSASESVTVKGAVVYQDPIVRLQGSDGKYSPTAGASVSAAQFQMIERPARGAAENIDLTPEGILNLRHVTFTSCRPSQNSWQLHARTLKLDTIKQVGTGRDATVDFQGVPVLYLPWFSFPLSNERKSGFLFPTIGNSTINGIEIEVPYYFNIAPNADLTFAPIYYSKRGIDLTGDARFLTAEQNGELAWHFLPNDLVFPSEAHNLETELAAAGEPPVALSGSTRSYLTFHDVASLPDGVRVLVDAANVSDPLYFQDFGSGPEATSTAFLQRLAEVTYRDEYWNLGAEAQQYQTIDLLPPVPLPDTYRPYARAPRFFADGDFGWGPGKLFHYGFDSELVHFVRDVGVTGWRLDLMPRLGLDYEDPAYFIRADVAWRYTHYLLDDTLPGEEPSPSRSLPISSFDTGLKLDRPLGAGGDRILTLEPRLMYLNVPYRNQDQLPLFDTSLPDLNVVELFRTNRYVGADRVGDANEVTLGVTSRYVNAATGQQYLSATLGQAYYLETPRVALPGEPLNAQRTADLVGELVISAYQNWNVNLNIELSPDQAQSEREFVQLQYKPGPESVINIAYRYQRQIVLPSDLTTPGEFPVMLGPLANSGAGTGLDQIDVSGAWPITRDVNVLGRMVYDLDAHAGLDRLIGLEYRACCWRIRLLGRRYLINGTGQQDTAFLFQLQLSGLAGVGPASDAFLGTAIRGYSPPSGYREGL